MDISMLAATGLRRGHCHAASLTMVAVSLSLWVRAKTVDQQWRGNAERRAIFVGLWPSMIWLIGNELPKD